MNVIQRKSKLCDHYSLGLLSPPRSRVGDAGRAICAVEIDIPSKLVWNEQTQVNFAGVSESPYAHQHAADNTDGNYVVSPIGWRLRVKIEIVSNN